MCIVCEREWEGKVDGMKGIKRPCNTNDYYNYNNNNYYYYYFYFLQFKHLRLHKSLLSPSLFFRINPFHVTKQIFIHRLYLRSPFRISLPQDFLANFLRFAFLVLVLSSMVMEDNESCSSRVHDSSSPAQSRQQRQKLEVYNEVLRRLKDSDNEEAFEPGFDEELWAHFVRLPTRYLLP